VSEGTGSFVFSMSYPPGTTVIYYDLTLMAGDLSYDLEESAEVDDSGDPVTLSGTIDVPAGYYTLRVLLRNSGGAYAGKPETVHIYQNLTTETDDSRYTFAASDFSAAYLVTNTNDSGPGSLRQAIADAPTGQTIKSALEPGSVIELESRLEITKGLTIEGNGLTITRKATWTTIDDNSQLLLISGIYDSTVKINRVRFTGGRTTRYGGAIYNSVPLTLESCIFDDNQCTDFYHYGGAIYNSYRILNISGCTFYGNSANSYGGAISNGGTLNLGGTIFYGNTASLYPVVHGSGTANSLGYNVVDAPFGTGSAQCGWNQGTGDITVSALPVSGKSFKLLSDSEAAGIITARPPDYPAEDFYGNPIPAASANAGAVQDAVSGNGFYPALFVNVAGRGSINLTASSDEDGFVSAPITLQAVPSSGDYCLAHWLINGEDYGSVNPLTMTLTGHSRIQAVFGRNVTNPIDSGGADTTPGTLRYAVTNALAGDYIRIVPGVTTIALQSRLSISKSLTIEGNGLTITRVSWTTIGSLSQLLYVSGSSTTAKISRVRFTGGMVISNGGAIHNSDGTLTLESCIFDDNQNTGPYGGAISNGGILNISGCTFYGNSIVDYPGGAIYNGSSGTLNLGGTIFYGNTSSSLPIVYNNGTLNSLGYNLVDVAFGTGYAQCGWTQGTGDATFASLGISGDPIDTDTFEPVTALRNLIPSAGTVTGFPALDFNGDTRTFPGAPGAVK
jgi:hypothetical protein